MAIHGSLEEAGLPNVLQLVALGGKTGCIAVERANVHGAIYLDGGLVVWAEIVSAGDRLGDHLVRSGKVTKEQLRGAIVALTEDSARTFPEVLVESGAIARGELDRFIQHQVEEAIYLMCSWTQGQFTFTANIKPPRHANTVSLHAEKLLLEAGRRADDWLVIQEAIPSFDRVYRRAAQRPGAASADLASEHHRILPLLDGTRDVNGLIELSGMSTFEVAKVLLDLIMSGAVQLQERRSSVQHFEEAELLAYAMRSGEFVDLERRKDAARHIADCQMCGGRLREIHTRRTIEAPPKSAAPRPPQPPTVTAPLVAKPVTANPPAANPPAAKPPAAKPPAAAPPLAQAQLPPPPPPPTPPATAPLPPSSRLSKDIVWLTSPEEADEARRSQHRARIPEASDGTTQPTKAAAPPPPRAATPPVTRVPAPAAAAPPPPPPPPKPKPVPPEPKPAPPQPKPATKTAARLIAVPPTRPAVEPARESDATTPTAAPRITRRAPWRLAAIAAAGVVVMLVGYVAMGTMLTRADPPVQTATANRPAPAAAAPTPALPETIAPTPRAAPVATTDSALSRTVTDTARTPAPTRPSVDSAVPRVAAPVAAPAAPVAAPVIAPVASPAPDEPTPAPPRRAAARDTTPATPTEPLAPDAELAAGGWRIIDRAEAIAALGGRIAGIPGLRFESYSTSEARGRTRVRVAQLARTGQRIVLIETASAEAAPSGAARATAVSVMPPLEGSSESIGSASLGHLQITARSSLAPDALRPLLGRLGFISQP